MTRKLITATLLCILACAAASAQKQVSISVDSRKQTGTVDEMLYGQLFEHIYFSANNGVWNEMIFERSFEPEHYPGITPRDGYFDGWFLQAKRMARRPPLQALRASLYERQLTSIVMS